jgi:hypothetical protein
MAQLRTDVVLALLLDDGPTLGPIAIQAPLDFDDAGGLQGEALPRTEGPFERDSRVSENLALPFGTTTHCDLATLARSIKPTVHVTIPALTLLGVDEMPATLNGVTPVPAGTARMLAALAPSLTRLLTDPLSGNVLAVDSVKYRPGKALASYIEARDLTCRVAGCHRKADLDIDHTVDFALGGHTTVTNLARLCRAHHTLKTMLRYTVEQATDGSGRLRWTSPIGTVTTTDVPRAAATTHRTMPEIPDDIAKAVADAEGRGLEESAGDSRFDDPAPF